ncbi:hypothetical protein LWI28_010247 [Acer negundo]|uniref:Uncharacterized protein n=1 Tax=Acer negundo TaxID=4023 RepID=A0AAD5J4H2_ACENE|nr:hypothetical protein LWI28_010247 [Acer negundo]
MLNLPKLEGVGPKPETKPLAKEIKPPDSTIIQPTQSFNQSTKTINLNIDPTPNLPTLPYPNRKATITPPNQNLPTLSYPNPKTPPNQTQFFQAIIQNTAAHLVANRPSTWPNKSPINTNTNTNTNKPKPWPDEPPIHIEHKLRTSFDESRKLIYKHGEEETSRGGVVSPSLGLLRTKLEGQFHNFSSVDCALNLVQNRVLVVAQLQNQGKEIITLENHCHVYRIDVLLRVPLFVQQLLQDSKHGQREKKKLWIWIEEFGDFWLGFRLLGISEDNLKNLGIFWKSRSKNQRKIKKKIWEFTSKDFCLWVVEEEGISELGFSEKNWGFREGFQIRCGQGESKAFKRCNPNPVSKRYCFGALVIRLAGALLRTGSIRLGPIGLLVQLVAISVLGKMGCIAFNKFFNF